MTSRQRFPRVRRLLGRIPHPPLRSRRGALLLFVLLGGTGAAMTIGATMTIAWTDTTQFCGSCHTMAPELKAYAASAHSDVACVECHTEPGLAGWVKAKWNGTRQLFEILTGTFPTPIPPPDHSELPSTEFTCRRCHNVGRLVEAGGPIKLVVHDQYALDPPSTRETVALVVRPNGFGGQGTQVGVHWHIDSNVEYLSQDPRAQQIDYVSVTRKDGTFEEFIASRVVTDHDNPAADVARLETTANPRRMDCIDCHNRVGHEVPTIDNAIDGQISAGAISTDLPEIKLQALQRLSAIYGSESEADSAISSLRDFYATRYPLVAQNDSAKIDAAIGSLETTYRLLATPEMKADAATYPNNIGHQQSPGCFRCHDGAHYKIVNGKVSTETIPSQCSTCHTFPQIGVNESGVLIGQRPTSHEDRLWVFDHKLSVTSADPTNQSCAACHTKTYCENCHKTTAVQVSHDSMVTNHAAAARDAGGAACAFCHAPAYCAQCHADPVLPAGPAGTGQVPSVTDEDIPPPSPQPSGP